MKRVNKQAKRKMHAFAAKNDLTIVNENAAVSAITLSGTVAQIQNLFEVKLRRREREAQRLRARSRTRERTKRASEHLGMSWFS
jgi:hypothetical protein